MIPLATLRESAPAALPRDLSTYAYSYPHKSSYRALSPPVQIADAWREEEVDRLSLYVHIPFCEMRCGFCNLFTQSQPASDSVTAYLATLRRQMRAIRDAVPGAVFRQCAIGGGTPTFLSAVELADLLAAIETTFSQSIRELPTSIETSPATATPDRLQVLASYGAQRISLGVQSFIPAEAARLGRPQDLAAVLAALDAIRASGIPELNVDLIYGLPEQTVESWSASLRTALRYQPEELYLYPLYVRPQTGLSRQGRRPPAHRTELYRAARDLLSERGYVQTSLRCFRMPQAISPSTYACQRDGMIGLGCGARSYTRNLHYATRYAATQAGVRAVLHEWIGQTDADLALATHGICLSADEQRRRYVIMSLLQAEGLSLAEHDERFPEAAITHLPGILELCERGWLTWTDDRCVLTPAGLENSDAVGPILYSDDVRERLLAVVRSPDVSAEGVAL